ncbi:MAG TPA: ABC transporter permease subunit [Ktedonobacteraceae bacterium]|jgi:ABC-type transport system involved in multi-copper enzyme maturation permease subunit|nr:ABC transporter permease subunit [Ktedonobacteraceae bacterium]
MSQTIWPSAPVPFQSTAEARTATLWELTRNELFKLWHRRLVWGMLILDLVFVFAAWCVLVYYATKTSDGFTPGHLLGGANGLSDAIGQPMTLGRRAGEFIAAALGALTFGGEFSSGSIRLVLSRGVNRASYLAAKYIALAIACVALVIAGLLMSMLLTNFLLIVHRPAPTLLNLNGPTLLTILAMCGGTLENFLFCLLFGATLSILARSAAFGIAASFGYLIGEDIAAAVLPVIGKSLHTPLGNQLANLLFTTNLDAFYANSLPTFLAKGLDQLDGVIACNLTAKACVPVNIGQSFAVALIWALVLGAISTYLFIKRDVLQ